MPFTPTHILAVVPIAAAVRKLPFSALAIGSMTPDFPMFVAYSAYHITHRWSGLFVACLPLGMAAFMLFQGVMKRPLVALMPVWIQQRSSDWNRPLLLPSILFFLAVSAAIVTGAATHIIWDSFTHEGQWGTRIVPALNTEVTIAGYSLPGYKIFQYGSSVVGLPLLVLLAAAKLKRTEPVTPTGVVDLSVRTKSTVLLILCLIPLVVLSIAIGNNTSIAQKLGTIIRISGASLIVAILVYSVIFHAILLRRSARGEITWKSRPKSPAVPTSGQD